MAKAKNSKPPAGQTGHKPNPGKGQQKNDEDPGGTGQSGGQLHVHDDEPIGSDDD